MSKNNGYSIDNRIGYIGQRCSDKDYLEQRRVLNKFKVMKRYPKSPSWCGNIRANFYNGQCKLEDLGSYGNDLAVSSQEEISSALALYRILAAVRRPPFADNRYVDFYKLNWEYILKHKKTGKYLVLGEWKGGFQIFTPFYSVDDAPLDYKHDVQDLLTALVSREWPIGYDGTVAGEVA